MPRSMNQPQLPGALADMLLRTYGAKQAMPAPAEIDPVAKMIAAADITGVNPQTGQPYGTVGPIKGELAGTYVDPATSAINAGDLGAAARGGAAPAAPAAGMPKREDFPPGLPGQGQYNRALIAWRRTAGV